MDKEQEYINLIQRYLKQQLSDDELINVERLLENESEFKTLFESEKIVFDTVVLSELYELEKEVRAYEHKENKQGWRYLGAGLLFLLGLVMIGHFSSNKSNKSRVETSLLQEKIIYLEAKQQAEKKVRNLDPKELNPTAKKESRVHNHELVKKDSISPEINNFINEKSSKATLTDSLVTQGSVVLEEKTVRDSVNDNKCLNIKIEFNARVYHTCEGELDGVVEINKIEGGNAPYEIISENTWTMEGETKFIFLPEGEVVVYVRDKEGCKSKQREITVEAKPCNEEQEISISISNRDYFEIDFEGELTIVSEYGQIVFQEEVEEGFKWYGLNNNGNSLITGAYSFMFRSEDINRVGVINVLE